MTTALASIVVSFLLGAAALLLVLFRVSPLTAPEFALPFFFLSVFTTSSTLAILLLVLTQSCLYRHPPEAGLAAQPFLSRGFVRSSLRQGMFVGIATCIVLFLYLLRIYNFWIAVLVYAVFVLIEMAVGR